MRSIAWFALGSLLIIPALARSQGIPAVPGVPAVPAAPAVPATPGIPGTPAAPSNIWSKILLTPDQKAACKKHFCESGIVQFLGVMLKPMTLATGGLIKPCCPGPDDARPEDLAKPADSADGAAARIKEDEAQAKQRRANVRYLGTVDCARYPEAEMALINALRTDRNECVRFEAASVLGSGCCCTKKVIEALQLTAMGSDKDKNPKETSLRVRAAAEASLYACQGIADYTPEPPEPAPGGPLKEGPMEAATLRPRIRPVPMKNDMTPVQATKTDEPPVQASKAASKTASPLAGLLSQPAPTLSSVLPPLPTLPPAPSAFPTPRPTPVAASMPAASANPYASSASNPPGFLPSAITSASTNPNANPNAAAQMRVPTGQRGLFDLIRRSFNEEPPQ